MRYTIFTVAAAASFASAQSLIPVGANCDPNGTACALGANCYATNSMLQTVCGNFQAACTSDQQCAFNTCNTVDGLCNGFLASSSAAPSASAPVMSTATAPGALPAPSSTVVAPAGSLPLGAQCNAEADDEQCANDVNCWASTSMGIAYCGNFNAECSSDAQCAYNTCSEGLCRGFLASSARPVQPSSMMSAPLPSTMMNGTVPALPTGTAAPTPTGNATATSTGPAEFTGAASVNNVAGGVMALAVGAIAWAL